MTTNVPDIKVKLTPEGVKDVVNALRAVQKESEAQARKAGLFGQLRTSAARALDPVNALKSALPALGLAAVATGVLALAKNISEFADNTGKAAQRVGTSAEMFSVLAFGAQTAEVGVDEMEKSLSRLARNIGDFKNGVGSAGDSMAELGLSAADFAGKDTAQAFELIAKRIMAVKDEGDRVRLAMDLLGKGGARLIPLMKDVAENGLGAMTEAAKAFGAFVSTDMARQSEQFNDSMRRVEISSQKAARAMFADMLPALTEISSAMETAAREGGFWEAVLVGIGGAISAIFFGTDIGNAQKEVKKLTDEVERLAKSIATGKTNTSPMSFIPLAMTHTEEELDALKKMMEKKTVELAAAQKKLENLQTPASKKSKAGPSDDVSTEAFDAQKRAIDLTKKLKVDELKVLQDAAARQRTIQEGLIKEQFDLIAARLAGNNSLQAQQALEAAGQQALAARSQLAVQSFNDEIKAIDLRSQVLARAVQKEIADINAAGGSSKRSQEVLTVLTKQSLDARIQASTVYFQKLLSLQGEHIQRYKQAQEAIKAIDKEVIDNRFSREKTFEDIRLAGLSAEDAQSARIAANRDKEAALRTAVLKGDLETARKLREEIVATSAEIARGFEGGNKADALSLGKAMAERADELLNLALSQKRQNEKANEALESKSIEDVGAKLKKVDEQIKALTTERLNTIDLKFGIDQNALTDLIGSIKDRLANERFPITVSPNVSGGGPSGGPGFARGGRIPGSSPTMTSDNVAIWATAGEFMQPVRAVRHYGLDFMESIRNMSLPKFAGGGEVGGGGGVPGSISHLDLTVNKRPIGRVTGSRDSIRGLVDMLQEVARGTA